MKLSLLICTIPWRKEMLKRLLNQIADYSKDYFNDNELELIIDDSINVSIGFKRNRLLDISNGKYIAFIDDDDSITESYFKEIRKGIDNDVDCCSLRGIITWNGGNPELFEHSIKYTAWNTTTNQIKYERFPNHLNCIKSEIAKQVYFPELNHGEDKDWSYKLRDTGLVKTEHFIDEIIYNYQYITNK
jgi:glycosyltransferase involved in cell wall biosynthesis